MVAGILWSGPDGFLAAGPARLRAAHDAPPVAGNGSLHTPAGRFSLLERSFNLRFRVSRAHAVDNVQRPRGTLNHARTARPVSGRRVTWRRSAAARSPRPSRRGQRRPTASEPASLTAVRARLTSTPAHGHGQAGGRQQRNGQGGLQERSWFPSPEGPGHGEEWPGQARVSRCRVPVPAAATPSVATRPHTGRRPRGRPR